MSRVRTVNNAASTSTGIFPSTATYPNGLDLYGTNRFVTASIQHPSTKTLSWIVQGSLHGTHWQSLSTTTTSTGTTSVNLSSGTKVFNRLRVSVVSNNTTGNVTTTWTVGATP